MIHISCVVECGRCGKLASAILKRPGLDTGGGGLFGGTGIHEELHWPRGSKEARKKAQWFIECYGDMFCSKKCKTAAEAKGKAEVARYEAKRAAERKTGMEKP